MFKSGQRWKYAHGMTESFTIDHIDVENVGIDVLMFVYYIYDDEDTISKIYLNVLQEHFLADRLRPYGMDSHVGKWLGVFRGESNSFLWGKISLSKNRVGEMQMALERWAVIAETEGFVYLRRKKDMFSPNAILSEISFRRSYFEEKIYV